MAPTSSYRALAHRNFRLLWIGQSISLPGSMMQNTAVLWHVSLLAGEGNKALALGMVGLVRLLPILVFSLFGGVVADALDRRKLMLATQIVMAALACVLAGLCFAGVDSLSSVYLLTALSAGAAAFDGPARSALVPSLVPREHLSNAVSLNTTLFQLSSVIGPALAGAALIGLPIGWVYALNALSFVAVIAGLLAMRDVPQRPAKERVPIHWRSCAEGLRFVFSAPLIRASMLLDFNAAVFASASALLPIFAQDVLKVGPLGFGWLCAAPSIGAVAASAFMVRFENRIQRRGTVLLWAVAAYGAATVLFGMSEHFGVTMLCLALIGASDTINMVLRNVIRQLHTPDHMRGRMMSVNVVFAKGGPELGEMEAGFVAHAFGAPISVITGGIASMLATAWIAWKTPVLRAYGSEAEVVLQPVPRVRPAAVAPVPVSVPTPRATTAISA